ATTKTDRTGRKRQTTLRKASRRGTPAQKNVPAKRTPSLSTRVTPPKIRQGSSSNRKSSSNATPKKSLTVQERRTSQQTVESRKAISNAETTKMKLHFESNLDYQLSAIESVCDVFRGQEICRTEFTVTRHALAAQQTMAFAQSDLGIGNRLQLLDDELLKNVSEVQVRNGLRPSASLTSGDFTIEMETGTGKTYVYLRTVFELNRRYGFTKFVIVVPSVAIKEGVYKTLQITEEHFRALYANTPFEYFLYDSSKLGQVRNFAASPNIQIMVVTVGAINKNVVFNVSATTEKTGGEKPIDLIRATQPILIVDEPQSVDGGLEGRG